MKNYFVFLDFFKKLEVFGTTITDISHIGELKSQTENLIFNEAKMAKNSNMDIDGIQRQITEYDNLLTKIANLSQTDTVKIENQMNGERPRAKRRGSAIQTNGPEHISIFKDYDQKIAKLELDLKREKELRQVKYYRTDKKNNEIKRLHTEKDELLDRCQKYENMMRDLNNKNMHLLNENQQLNSTLHRKTSECQELNNLLTTAMNPKIQNKLSNMPHTLHSKHIIRITELETEIEELKELIKSFEIMSKKNAMPGDTKDLLEKMSVMLLNKNLDPNFFSESQKEVIRSLFGDYATNMYKDKI